MRAARKPISAFAEDVMPLHASTSVEVLPCFAHETPTKPLTPIIPPRLCPNKRVIDCIGAALALLCLSPLLLLIALVVSFDGGSMLFVQPRVGLNGKIFKCYKFRSMRVDAENVLQHHLASDHQAARHWALYQKLPNDVRANDVRVTLVGRFIRRFSLDELPQLFNVLRGDMSLVGPRPIMPHK